MTTQRMEVRKTVVFNVSKEEDRRLVEFAGRRNFSELVRKYLRAELAQLKASSATIAVQRSDAHHNAGK